MLLELLMMLKINGGSAWESNKLTIPEKL